jgi:hypothetical protein
MTLSITGGYCTFNKDKTGALPGLLRQALNRGTVLVPAGLPAFAAAHTTQYLLPASFRCAAAVQ